MNYRELIELIEVFKEIPDQAVRDKGVQLMLKATSENVTYDSLTALLIGQSESRAKEDENGKPLKFTKQEISKMPTRFRKEFLIDDKIVKCRRRKSGKHSTNYEIRYRKHGYNIAVSSNSIDEAKEKFIQAINATARGEVKPTVPTTFKGFAAFYFEKYRKRKVKKLTFENDMYRYNKHILPYFGTMQLKEIAPSYCQKLIDDFVDKGMTKTANEIYSLLNGIFKMAIAYNLITRNPLAVIIVEKHRRTHGSALTKEEEKRLLEETAGTRYQQLFAVALYTGLRPNEYPTARIEKDFIIAKNSKRKGDKEEFKRIPISPMLKPYLNGTSELQFPRVEYMRDKINVILPNHILYDLRTTFYTRCEECGVAPPARDEFVGHSRGELNKTYSDLSDAYLLKEGKKLVW